MLLHIDVRLLCRDNLSSWAPDSGLLHSRCAWPSAHSCKRPLGCNLGPRGELPEASRPPRGRLLGVFWGPLGELSGVRLGGF
eukprot:1450078-Pyramimonas_sp.AAC.1